MLELKIEVQPLNPVVRTRDRNVVVPNSNPNHITTSTNRIKNNLELQIQTMNKNQESNLSFLI